MRILGIDPSLRNTGLAVLDLHTKKCLDTQLIQTLPSKSYIKKFGKIQDDFRTIGVLIDSLNSYLDELGTFILTAELPSGSQSSSGAKSAYVSLCMLHIAKEHHNCVAHHLYTPTELKMALVGKRTATKQEMIAAAIHKCPSLGEQSSITNAKGKILVTKAEHIADAYASIHKYLTEFKL